MNNIKFLLAFVFSILWSWYEILRILLSSPLPKKLMLATALIAVGYHLGSI